jgi:hypothetical protein
MLFAPLGSVSVPKCNNTVSDKYLFLRRLLRERSRDAGPSYRTGLLRPARLSPGGDGDWRGAHHACAQAWHHRRPPANPGSAPGEIHIVTVIVSHPYSFDPDPEF